MRLDQTKIVVRERGLLETFDLSLHVFRHFGVSLLGTFLLGALPFFIVNDLLLGWMIDSGERESFFYLDDVELIARFVWNMSIMVAIQAPLASVLTTAYLGQAMFVDRPRFAHLVRDVWRLAPRLGWCQGLVRGVLPALLLVLTLERYGDLSPFVELIWLPLLAGYALCLRLWRPFINEIILLERNPLVARRGALTAARRSRQLHGPSSGDLFARGIASLLLACLLTLAVFGSFIFVSGVFLSDWQPGPLMVRWILPVSMWLTACYLTVVRFLNYLDLRIRHEGWEVELRFRAEAERVASRLV